MSALGPSVAQVASLLLMAYLYKGGLQHAACPAWRYHRASWNVESGAACDGCCFNDAVN